MNGPKPLPPLIPGIPQSTDIRETRRYSHCVPAVGLRQCSKIGWDGKTRIRLLGDYVSSRQLRTDAGAMFGLAWAGAAQAGARPMASETRDSMWNATQKTSFGQGSMIALSSGPFTVFMSAVSPPWRSSHFFTVSG
jgi:hypothetical protein